MHRFGFLLKADCNCVSAACLMAKHSIASSIWTLRFSTFSAFFCLPRFDIPTLQNLSTRTLQLFPAPEKQIRMRNEQTRIAVDVWVWFQAKATPTAKAQRAQRSARKEKA
ncbi:hypothetical protein LPW11_09990 [Geomonas sp. RF6]|uniref:hypothetical protein n=1 Tax=Geomonas sp. RF6 TaxID=2897342 RepID=UPI001E39DDDE|nr:hypothetical protein [Geomonas sp. RF6]UFS72504.1 hypothetical protein LPW11_09990 [Geomonas sp. RF6]